MKKQQVRGNGTSGTQAQAVSACAGPEPWFPEGRQDGHGGVAWALVHVPRPESESINVAATKMENGPTAASRTAAADAPMAAETACTASCMPPSSNGRCGQQPLRPGVPECGPCGVRWATSAHRQTGRCHPQRLKLQSAPLQSDLTTVPRTESSTQQQLFGVFASVQACERTCTTHVQGRHGSMIGLGTLKRAALMLSRHTMCTPLIPQQNCRPVAQQHTGSICTAGAYNRERFTLDAWRLAAEHCTHRPPAHGAHPPGTYKPYNNGTGNHNHTRLWFTHVHTYDNVMSCHCGWALAPG